MNERPINVEKPDKQFDLEYGRELFINLFKDSTPFINMGYSPSQIELAKIPLRLIEEEGTQSGNRVQWRTDDYVYSTNLHGMNYGGFYLEGGSNHMLLFFVGPEEDRVQHLRASTPRVKFFDYETEQMFALAMVPSDIDDTHSLVTKLYETSYGEMKKRDLIDNVVPRQGYDRGIYTAAWMDDKTKLDLVVKYKHKTLNEYLLAEIGQKDGKIDVWRRLPNVELEGAEWTPYGRKPNTSVSQAMSAFEKKEDVFNVQFGTEKV